MSNVVFAGVAGAVAAGAICAIFYLRRRSNQIKYATEQIESELQYEDVISYFRSLNLNKDKDTPFIANCNHENCKKYVGAVPTSKDGYKLLFVGVYNANKDIFHGKFIYSLGWSKNLTEIIGEEPVVVLQ